MPRRNDIESICIVGSGPIVIGQAAEFDYAGCQALKVLREDGFRTIVVNSNPATIMTDPGFADRTYLEPLDAESRRRGAAHRAARRAPADDGRPDRAQPRARARERRRPRRARDRADRRAPRRDRARRGSAQVQGGGRDCGLKVPTSAIVTSLDELDGVDGAGRRPARVHARRPRRRVRLHRGGAAPPGRARPRGVARSARCSSRSRCAAGTSSSSRWSATASTTSSSSARSRTSTRWASTPATPSRSRRR